MMARFCAYILMLVVACGCSRSQVTLEGRIIGAHSTTLYLERVDGSVRSVVDSVELNEAGDFRFVLNDMSSEPKLFHVNCGAEHIPLFLSSGDRVFINSLGNMSQGYRVEGSQESELLREFFQPYYKGMGELEQIAALHALPSLSDSERKELTHAYGKVYQSIKQEQMRFIIENKDRLAAVYALMQRLPGDSYLFNESSDLIYFRTVAQALEESYPESTYLKSLRNVISNMESSITLKSTIKSVDFPEIEMPDMYGQSRSLTSLVGQVILLNFWSPEAGNSNAQNAELKEIYAKFRAQGFEVYQVGVTTSKSKWISTVQEQRLPWISVSDMRGATSPALGVYNVATLPTSFLIDNDGVIVARDVAIDDTLESRIEELLK